MPRMWSADWWPKPCDGGWDESRREYGKLVGCIVLTPVFLDCWRCAVLTRRRQTLSRPQARAHPKDIMQKPRVCSIAGEDSFAEIAFE